MKLTDLLDQIDRLDQEATKGPWHVAPGEDDDGSKFPWAIFGPKNDLWGAQGWGHEHYIQEIPELTIPDAEFIALARTALPQLAKAVRNVKGVTGTIWDHLNNPVNDEVRNIIRDAMHDAISDALEADDD